MSLLVQELQSTDVGEHPEPQNMPREYQELLKASPQGVPLPGDVQVDNCAVGVDHLANLSDSSLNTSGSKG
jgi:hypothetical protein